MTADFYTKLVSDLSRPSIAGACGIAIAIACFIPASAPIAIPAAAAIVMTYFGGKSYENVTSTKTTGATDIAANKPTDVSVTAEVK